ncbi:helix-turn-helix domain-containing protein [Rhodococcus qingshengii]|uniref:helix-turn-helix domain-containing protein n=1 Tax=Rhodococcus qingshengii TaxID=334542 RepID=UPI0010A671FC|nr:helix-turn-helix domain-containing protein [Rhodococcus qingshengii]THJ69504.1 helix-turn-helix domain-containing protein [Rhodococcus qingshengii]
MSRTHMTVKAIAERWDCDPNSVYRLVRSKSLPALHIGGKAIRIPVAAVEEFESSNTTA